MLRNRKWEYGRGLCLALAREYAVYGKGPCAYVAQAKHLPGLQDELWPRVHLVAAAPGCLDGWQGPAVLDPALPENLRATLAPRVKVLNRAVEGLRYRATCRKTRTRPVARIAR